MVYIGGAVKFKNNYNPKHPVLHCMAWTETERPQGGAEDVELGSCDNLEQPNSDVEGREEACGVVARGEGGGMEGEGSKGWKIIRAI